MTMINTTPGGRRAACHTTSLARPVVALLAALLIALLGLVALAPPGLGAQVPAQTQADDYTRYELLDPTSHGFRILYDVTATTPGARVYFNGIRAGAEEEVHGVMDRSTGDSLRWSVVGGDVARREGLPRARLDGHYIRVELPRPVPAGGEVRLRIDKTYWDAESYWGDADTLTFSRSLGIERNAIVLPSGWEPVGVNYPSQVISEDDGRIKISFFDAGPGSVPLVVKARRLPPGGGSRSGDGGGAPASSPVSSGEPTAARVDWIPPERAAQDREIVYFLQQPETHSFRLYHDYTETRPGMDRYLNVVRAGSRVSDPSAVLLDTGEALPVETVTAGELAAMGVDVRASPETEVVVIRYPAVQPGTSARLRIHETYTDPGRYLLHDGELVWDRSFGRSRNAVVLPAGWSLTTSSIPAVVTETDDGRIRLDFVNYRPDDIRVFIRARRR